MVTLAGVALLVSLGAQSQLDPGRMFQLPTLQFALLGESSGTPSVGDWPVERPTRPPPAARQQRSLVPPIVLTSIGAVIVGGSALGAGLVLSEPCGGNSAGCGLVDLLAVVTFGSIGAVGLVVLLVGLIWLGADLSFNAQASAAEPPAQASDSEPLSRPPRAGLRVASF